MDFSFSPALVWAVIGLVLLICELATLSFILCFIGLGALIVALTTWLGLTPGLSGQLVVFSVSSLALLFLFRKTARRLFAGHADVPPDYMGEKVPVVKAIGVHAEGSIRYRGSEWIAISEESREIPAGAVVEIIGMDGIRVIVKPLS